MKTPAQITLSIDRFRDGFWGRERIDHPPVGVFPDRALLPVNYLKIPFDGDRVVPADVTPVLTRTDYEDASFGRRVLSDDFMPFNAAWRAVPWLEAICGCGVAPLPGSLVPVHVADTPEELAALPLPAGAGWDECLQQQNGALVESNPADCWVSPTILRGPSDVLAGIRGQTGFFLDLYDAPDLVAAAAARVNDVLLGVLDRHFAAVPPHLGGYGHIFGYWAPEPTIAIQQDMIGMCSPDKYLDLFLPLDARIVEHLGPYTIFHLHSTGYQHYRHVLEIPGLGGLQITIEANGPRLLDLAPVFREVLDRTRLILFVDAQFEDLVPVLRLIPHEGLYLMVSDRFIPDEAAYQDFLSAVW